MSVHPEVAESVDMSQPMYWDRRDTPLPDKRYKDVLTGADESLKQKEKGPWSQLTKEEKIACRGFFTHRLRRLALQPNPHVTTRLTSHEYNTLSPHFV